MNDGEKLVSKIMGMGAAIMGRQLLKATGDCQCRACHAIREVWGTPDEKSDGRKFEGPTPLEQANAKIALLEDELLYAAV